MDLDPRTIPSFQSTILSVLSRCRSLTITIQGNVSRIAAKPRIKHQYLSPHREAHNGEWTGATGTNRTTL